MDENHNDLEDYLNDFESHIDLLEGDRKYHCFGCPGYRDAT